MGTCTQYRTPHAMTETRSTPQIPLLDVVAGERPLRPHLDAAIARVLDSGRYIGGSELTAFESELANAASTQYAVGVSSGTDALLVALMALGVGPGDEVVTTPFSFFATAGVIARLGATPVFADIDEDSLNLDPLRAAAACSSRTKAVITVHLYGRPATLPAVSVPVVEDAAQSLSAVPTTGRCATISFFPSKNLGALGDGGALLTDDAEFAETVRMLRNHGGKPKYYHAAIGGNFRLDTLQAAVLRVKLPHLSGWIQARRDNADRYRELFVELGVPADVRPPRDVPEHVYNQFVIRVPRRDQLQAYLRDHGVATAIYYPVPFHLQPCFANLGYAAGAFPLAERAAAEVLALPVFPSLGAERQRYVVERIADFYRS